MPSLPGVLGMLASGSPKEKGKKPPARGTPVKTGRVAAPSKGAQDAPPPDKKHLQKQVKEAKNSAEERKKAAELLEANAGKFEAPLGESDEPSDAAEEKGTTWDSGLRLQLAESAWSPEAGGTGLASSVFDPTAAAAAEVPGPLEFARLASVIQESAGGDPALALRVLTNFMRQLLCGAAEHREGNLHAALAVLLKGQRGFPHRILEKGVADAFGLNKDTVHAIAPEELASAALAGRKKLQVLSFQRRRLRASDVAAALDPGLQQPDQPQWGPQALALRDRLQERVTRAIGGSTADEQETYHLVRVLQGRMGFSCDLGLRALAQAVVLSPPGAGEPPSWQDAKSRAEAMVTMEDAVQKAFAQDGGHTGRLLGALMTGTGPAGLPAACVPAAGAPVLPMRLQADGAQDAAGALQRLGGAVLAEWRMQGERAQVHVQRGGKEIAVFVGAFGRVCSERPGDAISALRDHLQAGVSSCILEVIFAKVPRKDKDAKDAKDAKDEQIHPRVMMPFDILALNGQPLVDLPLRERRKALLGAVREHAGLRLVRSSEVGPSDDAPAELAAHLDESLSASYLAGSPAEKACCKAVGLVLKSLDGPGAAYWAGRSHSAWLGLEKPAVVGPEADRLLLESLSEEERKHWPSKEDFHFTVISGFRTRSVEGINDILKIQKLYNDAGVAPTWYVDNDCPEEYRQLGLQVVQAGKLIPARNKALEEAYALGKACVQTSDDIGCWQFVNDAAKYSSDDEANSAFARAQKFNVSPVAAAQYLMAKMRSQGDEPGGCRLGGVYCLSNGGRAMRGTPSGLQHFILGDFFVAEVSECRFDERLTLKEDYDFTCSHLQRHGMVFRCNRMLITAKHETNAGGACAERDAAGTKEQENVKILKEKWPGAIRDHGTRANQVTMCWKRLNMEAEYLASKEARQKAAKRKQEAEEAEQKSQDAKKAKSSQAEKRGPGRLPNQAKAKGAKEADDTKPEAKPEGATKKAEDAKPQAKAKRATKKAEDAKPEAKVEGATKKAEVVKPEAKPEGPTKKAEDAKPQAKAKRATKKADDTKPEAKPVGATKKADGAKPVEKAEGETKKAVEAKRKAASAGSENGDEDKASQEGSCKKAQRVEQRRKQEPSEEEEKLIRSQIYELEEATPEEKAMIRAATVGFKKFMEGKVSQATIAVYSVSVNRCLVLQSRSFRAASSEAYRLLVQKTKVDVRSNRATSCGLSWFARFHAAVCDEHEGTFQVEAAWEEEASRERTKKTATNLDEAGMEVWSGGKGNHSSKYVGVAWNSRLKKWLAFSKDSKGAQRHVGFYATEELAAKARKDHISGKKPAKSIFSILGASAAARPENQVELATAAPAGDPDLEETVLVVSIMDPVSLMRIEAPVRGKNCTHKGIFDRDAYVEFNAMQEKRKFKNLRDLWTCPICSKPAPEHSLCVAEEFIQILNSAKKNEEIEHVAVLPDGTLSLLQ